MEIERLSEAVRQAYLDACERLGWPVKPENQVPYAELPEDSKELDRASVRAVLAAIVVEGWRIVRTSTCACGVADAEHQWHPGDNDDPFPDSVAEYVVEEWTP